MPHGIGTANQALQEQKNHKRSVAFSGLERSDKKRAKRGEPDLRGEPRVPGAERSQAVGCFLAGWSEATKTNDPRGRVTGPF